MLDYKYVEMDPCCLQVNKFQFLSCNDPPLVNQTVSNTTRIPMYYKRYMIRGLCDVNSNSKEYLYIPKSTNSSNINDTNNFLQARNLLTGSCFRIFIEDHNTINVPFNVDTV
jgi:hypothetical protein